MLTIRTLFFLIFAASAACAQEELRKGGQVAFLGITYLDTSMQGSVDGTPQVELDRVAMLEKMVSERFVAEGLVLMELSGISEDINRIANPAKCFGCDLRMGRKIGAEYVLVGEVQKVSNLILSMNLVLRGVDPERKVRGRSVEIRANTDEAWRRGMRYLLNNVIFRE